MSEIATTTFERERGRLTSLAYRMLGDRAAAEDVVQNAWLRWSKTDHETIQTPAAWLTTVTTRLAIDSLRSARHNREVYVGVWLPEPILSDPKAGPETPEEILGVAETVELALLWAMERLNPEERAAFILREAFDTDYSDIAQTLGKSEVACRQTVARARKRVHEESPKFNAPTKEVSDLLFRFVSAIHAQNKEEVLALLSPTALAFSDGGGKVRAALRPLVGPDDIVQVLMAVMAKSDSAQTLQHVLANGQPAFALLQGTEADLIVTITPDETGKVGWVYIMRNPDKLQRAQADINKNK